MRHSRLVTVAAKVTASTATEIDAIAEATGTSRSLVAAAAIVAGLCALAQEGRLPRVTSARTRRKTPDETSAAPEPVVRPVAIEDPSPAPLECAFHWDGPPDDSCVWCWPPGG